MGHWNSICELPIAGKSRRILKRPVNFGIVGHSSRIGGFAEHQGSTKLTPRGHPINATRLQSLQEESQQLDKNLQLVATPDTSAAFDFRNQLVAAQLLLQIETVDASFRIERLREYLVRNY